MTVNNNKSLNQGIVFTKDVVVKAMLNLIAFTADKNLKDVKILEPSAGEGAFVLEIIKRLYQSSINFNFSFIEAINNLFIYELESENTKILEKNITNLFKDLNIKIDSIKIHTEDFLLAKNIKVDYVIGNPPYIRWDNINKDLKEKYKKLFTTFNHRSDIYIPFYEKGLKSLKANGKLCFICSNRWLKNQYGKSLRQLISSLYQFEMIIDMEETQPFESDVIAYPTITTISNKSSSDTTKLFTIKKLSELNELQTSSNYTKLNTSPNQADWFSDSLIPNQYYNYFSSIEEQGYKIGIGVATGNDKLFISDSFDECIENELLIPIITSKELKQNSFRPSNKKIINPFAESGELIDLSKYPKAKKYFFQHKGALSERYVAQKNPAHWYKTIDKIKPNLTTQSKILLPDISGNSRIFIDEGNYYPHHNIYYVIGKDINNLKLLAAILMSDLMLTQLHKIGNKMNGGYPRWQSQNLRKLKIPILEQFDENFSKNIIDAYDKNDIELINQLVSIDKIARHSQEKGQMKLFE